MVRRDPTNLELADLLLTSAHEDMEQEEPNLAKAAQTIAIAQVRATMALAKELAKLRDEVSGVSRALIDQNGGTPGDHLRNIGESVERIAKR